VVCQGRQACVLCVSAQSTNPPWPAVQQIAAAACASSIQQPTPPLAHPNQPTNPTHACHQTIKLHLCELAQLLGVCFVVEAGQQLSHHGAQALGKLNEILVG
jgi:hypothetical protein